MTKAFVEPIMLEPKNEHLVRKAFSKGSQEKMKEYNENKRPLLKKISERKLNLGILTRCK